MYGPWRRPRSTSSADRSAESCWPRPAPATTPPAGSGMGRSTAVRPVSPAARAWPMWSQRCASHATTTWRSQYGAGATAWPAPPCATTGSSSTSRRCGPCGSTPPVARPGCRAVLCGATSTTKRRPTAWPRAAADEHPGLFWALRGGGGNFGVVTSFRFALHPVGPTVLAGPVFWAADDAADILRFYRDFAAEAPDELGSVVRLGTVPPLPGIPEDLHWRPAIAVACCYAGAVDDGERAVRALRRFGTPLVDLLAPSPYDAFQSGLDDTVLHGWHYYWKATNLAGLSDDAIAVIADHAYAAC